MPQPPAAPSPETAEPQPPDPHVRPHGRPQARARSTILELAQTTLCALAFAGVIRTFLVEPFTIPSSSMEPGLVTGDYILVSKFAYGWSRASFPFNPPLPGGRLGGAAPRRGDVVVFRRPVDPKAAWVKRVIGLPGDRVQVTAGRVTVNGQPLAQTAVSRGFDHDAPWRRVVLVRETDPDGRSHVIYGGDPTGSAENTAVYVVPPDRCFVMGDNRDNSADSRYPRDAGVGLLPTENIIGKAQIILFSWTPPVQGSRRGIGAGLALDRFFRPII